MATPCFESDAGAEAATAEFVWEVYPPALGGAVRPAAQASGGVPVIVTEDGIATADDAQRIATTRGALSALHSAMAEGIQVLGYYHWGLLDNDEWGRLAPTFGLIAVDRESSARPPKPSLAGLGVIARTGSLSVG